MSKILGIDLGTTNSCVAVLEATAPQVLPNNEGSRTTPSIVAFADDGDRLIGQIAKRQAITNPENTVFAVKRLIGRKFDSPEVSRARNILPYTLVAGPNGDVKVECRSRDYSPEEISSFVLQELRGFAQEALGENVSQAVITVPAYFDDSQRQATKDAGQIAGLDVLRIVNEPTAAALAYGLNRRDESQKIVVYDLGGGTFDVTVLQLERGVFEVKSTAGNTYLGGEDFDQRIMDWLISEFQGETQIDLRADRMALQRLKEAAERAKCDLSTEFEAAINLPFIAADAAGPRHLARTLTRGHFENLVGELVKQTEEPCLDALQQAGLRADEIDEVLLVGGQTRTPLVIQTVERLFGRKPNREINPDEVVAMGAAVQGAILGGEISDMVLLDVTPLSMGIETRGGLFVKLVERNSTIPTKNSLTFTTVVDNQDAVEIHVLQGEREIAKDNKSLGRFKLVGIPPSPRGVPQIDVSFSIDSNGIVNVSARDLATNNSQSIDINPASGLSKEEIEKLVKEAQDSQAEDARRREVGHLRNRLEGLVYANDRVFDQFRESLDGAQRKDINEALLKARMALASDDGAEIEEMIFSMNSVSQKLSELMMSKA